MRRTVTPTRPDARIFDPDHLDNLPPEGRELEITPFWLAHESQGNVTIAEAEPQHEPAPIAAEQDSAPK